MANFTVWMVVDEGDNEYAEYFGNLAAAEAVAKELNETSGLAPVEAENKSLTNESQSPILYDMADLLIELSGKG